MEKKHRLFKILALQDSEGDPSLITERLRKNESEFEVVTIDTKENYIKALSDYGPDIILFDDSFGALSIKEALNILKESELQVPLLLLTDNTTHSFGLKMFKAGVTDFIQKNSPENLSFFLEKTINKFNIEKEKLRGNEKLKETKLKFQGLIEASCDVVCILTVKGKIKFISPSIEHMLGITEKEANQKKLIDLLNLDNPEVFSEPLKHIISSPELVPTTILMPVKNKNDKSLWLQAIMINRLNNPSIDGIVVHLKDVTNEKISEMKILENEKKYRTYFENSADGIMLTVTDGTILAANPAACKMFQMTEEEICARGRNGLVNLKDPRFHQALKERERTGKSKYEMTMFRKDGSSFLAEISSDIIETNKQYAYLIIKDNTEKKQLKRDLKKSEERYKSLFKLNPLPTFVFNENDLSIVECNDSSSEKYGYTREEFLKMSLEDLRAPAEIEHLHRTIEKFRNSNEASFHCYSKHQKKCKNEILVENNSHRFYVDGIPHMVVVCNDITEKEKNLKQLTDTTDKLRVAEKIAKIGYWELNLQDNTLFYSAYISIIYGIEDPNFVPKMDAFIEMTHPVDRIKFAKEIDDLLSGIQGNETEFRIMLKDGTVKWLNSRTTMVTNDDGEVTFVKGVLQDITSEKIAFDKLARSESRYKGLIQSQTNYFVRIDMDGNYSFCNNKFIEEFGWAFPNNNPIGQSSFTDVAAYHHKNLRETGMHCVSHPDENCQLELDKRKKDGGVKTTLWDMIFLSDEEDGGEMQCVGIDISERVKVERKNEFQANLLNKIGQGIMATDSNQNITYWNKAAEAMYGWKKKEVMGKNIFNLLYSGFESHKETIQVLQSGESWTGELTAIRKDGSFISTQVTKSPLFDENNICSGVVNVSSDISKLKKSEIKLKKLNKDLKDYTKELYAANEGLQQFSYIVSHNLRAPIANILGIADLLEHTQQPKEIQRQLFKEAFSNVGRLDDVMQDLNETLKLKSKFSKKREPVELESLIQNIIASNQNLIDQENAKIYTDFSEVNEINTVRSYFYSTFFNLISNSIKYRKPDISPVMEIRTECKDDQVIIHFKDNGLGVDLEGDGNEIFGFYKRFHYHVEGKGLGLFMVKSQLEMMGGQIKVKSALGKGIEFTIYLKNNK